MNQILGGPLKDRTRKRREYLLKKAWANTLTFIGGVSTFSCAGMWVLALGGTSAMIALSKVRVPVLLGLGFIVPLFAVAFWLCFIALLFALAFWRSSAKAARAIPYVPPVREQVAALPAEEVLLRGSEQPIAAQDQLLTAVHNRTEIAVDELLRPTENNTR